MSPIRSHVTYEGSSFATISCGPSLQDVSPSTIGQDGRHDAAAPELTTIVLKTEARSIGASGIAGMFDGGAGKLN